MLTNSTLTAFLATIDPDRAIEFYTKTLGLKLISQDPFAIVFQCNNISLRIQKVDEFKPQPFTALGWQVQNIRDAVEQLSQRGVQFERYAFLKPDDLGIWLAPSGTKVAWFKDPDGNVLSISESPQE